MTNSCLFLFCMAIFSSFILLLQAATPYGIDGKNIYTKEELKSTVEPLLYLSVCGNVFNVTTGARFYGPGKMYNYFSNNDVSRGLGITDFAENNLHDDVTGLSGSQCVGLQVWLDFFHDHKVYQHLGMLEGYFYNSKGEETDGMKLYKQCVEQGKKGDNGAENGSPWAANQHQQVQQQKGIPECVNSIRESDNHHIVSCAFGYTPRKTYFTAGSVDNKDIKVISCVCVDIEELSNRHDVEVYSEYCNAQSSFCIFENIEEHDIHHKSEL